MWTAVAEIGLRVVQKPDVIVQRTFDSSASSRSSRKPRVLIVGQGPPTLGGIPTFVTKLTTDGWLGGQVDLEYLNTTPRGTKRPGGLRLGNVWFAIAHSYFVFRKARRASVVHLNAAPTPLLPLLRALLLCVASKAGGAKVLLHAHTGRLSKCIQSPSYRFLLRRSRPLIDRLIVVSREAEAALGALGCEAFHLENGVDVDEFLTGPKNDDKPLMTFLGTICARKGLLDLRDALVSLQRNSQLPPMEVTIVGDDRQEGPGEMKRVVTAYADELCEVEFTGALPPDQVKEILARTSIFCLPSHWEGLPLSLLEAMASRAAVVATRVGDVPDVLEDGECGIIVEPHDSHALAEVIGRLIVDVDLRRRLGDAARRRVEERYSFSQTTLALRGLYWELSGYSR